MWPFRKKFEPDYDALRSEAQRRIAAERDALTAQLAKTETKLNGMEDALGRMSERLNQGQLSAAAIAARHGGFSQVVYRSLERAQELCAPPTFTERYASDCPTGEQREREAVRETAEAGEYARNEHRILADKARRLREELRDL